MEGVFANNKSFKFCLNGLLSFLIFLTVSTASEKNNESFISPNLQSSRYFQVQGRVEDFFVNQTLFVSEADINRTSKQYGPTIYYLQCSILPHYPIALFSPTLQSGNGDRIWNGQPANEGAFPFAAAIVDAQVDPQYKQCAKENRLSYASWFQSGAELCTASILNDRTLLTAGHCTPGPFNPLQKVIVGAINIRQNYISRQERFVPWNQWRQHERFYTSKGLTVNDVALIYLDPPLQYFQGKVESICLTEQFVPQGTQVAVLGWGRFDLNRCGFARSSDNLLFWTGIAIQPPCKGIKTVDGFICSRIDYPHDQAPGDSGGPLVAKRNNRIVQVGVVSSSVKNLHTNCPVRNTDSGYASVYYYLNWIRSNALGQINIC